MSPAHPLVVEMVRARTERGVHHTGVHDTTGIARSTVRNWETGRRDPQLASDIARTQRQAVEQRYAYASGTARMIEFIVQRLIEEAHAPALAA